MILPNTCDVGRGSDTRVLLKQSLKFVTFCLLSFMFITKRKRFKRNPKAWKLAKTHRRLGTQFVQNIFISCSLSRCLQGHSVKSWCNMKVSYVSKERDLTSRVYWNACQPKIRKLQYTISKYFKSMKNINAPYWLRTRIFPIVLKPTLLHFHSAHADIKFSCPITQRLSSVWI